MPLRQQQVNIINLTLFGAEKCEKMEELHFL